MRSRSIVAFLCVAASSSSLWAISYTITGLGTLGGASSYATAINNSGQIVGYADTASGQSHAFLYSNGVMQDLTAFGGTTSTATDINDLGQIIGYADIGANSVSQGFVITNGVMTNLEPDTVSSSTPISINNHGVIVGNYGIFSNAIIYIAGGYQYLGGFNGYSHATGINDAGTIVGDSSTSQGTDLGFVYDHGTMTPLTGLGGQFVWPRDINASGLLVGTSYLGGPFYNGVTVDGGFLYGNGITTQMPAPGVYNGLNAINDLGHAVGISETSSYAWSELYINGTALNLQLLLPTNSGWLLGDVFDINNSDQIVGIGTDPQGKTEAFVLTPTPEPASAFVALALPFFVRRRTRV